MSGDHNQKPTCKDSLQVEAMKQALSALVNTGTHPMTSAERYDKEMQAMEALEDAIEDAIEQAEKREWVGLTEDEITELFCDYDASQFPKFVRTIEAKLKEKNAYGLQSINKPSEWLD
jgi:hypothetical protein